MPPTVPEVYMLDTSEILHGSPKTVDEFRNYVNSEQQQMVKTTYYDMHTHQTVQLSRQIRQKWLEFDHAEMSIMEALEILNNIIDESDPDTSLPNIVHAFQTAERIREAHPDKPWFHLTGLIHDLGKLMAFYEEPHWAVCGDTFVIGCSPDNSIVFGRQSFVENPDLNHEVYGTKYGIYEPHCGLDNLVMSWGHDEYLYQVLRHNKCSLPKAGMDMIRFHSFYPWHTSGAYEHLQAPEDEVTKSWVKEFNKFDLYSKSDDIPNIEEIKPYYQSLIDQYCPGKLRF